MALAVLRLRVPARFIGAFTTLVVTLIGIAGIAMLGDLVGHESDEVLPLLLSKWARPGGLGQVGAVVVFVGALAAIMSTADSCLLSLGAMVAGDLLGHVRRFGIGRPLPSSNRQRQSYTAGQNDLLPHA